MVVEKEKEIEFNQTLCNEKTLTENYLQKLSLHFTYKKYSLWLLISVISVFSVYLKTTFFVFYTH